MASEHLASERSLSRRVVVVSKDVNVAGPHATGPGWSPATPIPAAAISPPR
jgi:hypothetical protein